MNQLLLSISYDGTDYCGWIIQKNKKTIQGTLNKAIKKTIHNSNFKTLGGSKTDSGVHALDQKVSLFCNFRPSNLDRFCKAINKTLPDSIKINNIQHVPLEFNLFKEIDYKIYQYTINNCKWDFQNYRYELLITKSKLNIDLLKETANLFIGFHDFKNFSGLNSKEIINFNTFREIKNIEIEQKNQKILIKFIAKGFIRYQIRMMVGAMLKVSENKKYNNNIIKKILDTSDFNKFPFVAPPQGLILKNVFLKSKLVDNDIIFLGEK